MRQSSPVWGRIQRRLRCRATLRTCRCGNDVLTQDVVERDGSPVFKLTYVSLLVDEHCPGGFPTGGDVRQLETDVEHPSQDGTGGVDFSPVPVPANVWRSIA
ncbi:hypothetical protein TNCV_53381 [Trichonephila clavipes]|nr:hypothetical protein TNCV_53381 [Trichonephila clavipes]